MDKIVEKNINGFVLAMKQENYARADRHLEAIVRRKVENIYSEEYEKIKKQHKKDK